MAASIQRYAAKGVWDPPGYSQAVKVTGAQTILYLSGQVAYTDKGGPAHPGDFKAQARATFQAIKAQVEAGGGTMDSIVKINTYLTDIRNRPDLAAVREPRDAGVDDRDRSGRGHLTGAAIQRTSRR